MRAWEAGRQQKPGAETGQLMKPLLHGRRTGSQQDSERGDQARTESWTSTVTGRKNRGNRSHQPLERGEPDIYSTRHGGRAAAAAA